MLVKASSTDLKTLRGSYITVMPAYTSILVVLYWRPSSLPTSYTHNGDDTP